MGCRECSLRARDALAHSLLQLEGYVCISSLFTVAAEEMFTGTYFQPKTFCVTTFIIALTPSSSG